MSKFKVSILNESRLFCECIDNMFNDSRFEVANKAVRLGNIEPCDIDLLIFDPLTADLTSKKMQILRNDYQKARLVVLSDDPDPARMTAAVRAGVDGYLGKNIVQETLLLSLELIALGERLFPINLTETLIGASSIKLNNSPKTGNFLTEIDLIILSCLANGDSNKIIAYRLSTTEDTIKVRLRNLLNKIKVSNRTQAAIWAVNNHISHRTINGKNVEMASG